MLGSLKFLARAAYLILIYIFVFAFGLSLFYMVFLGLGFEKVVPIVTMLASVVPFGLTMSFYSYYLPIALSNGATRKSFFAAAQISKITLSVVISACIIIMEMSFTNKASPSLNTFLSLCAVNIIGNTFSESFGVLCLKLGKIGMYIFMGIFAIFGGIFGATFSSSILHGANANVLGFTQNLGVLWIVILLFTSVAFTIFNWIFMRKACVR